MEKDVKRTILRVLKGKKGTGRKRTQKEVYSQMQRYRQITATVSFLSFRLSALSFFCINRRRSLRIKINLCF